MKYYIGVDLGLLGGITLLNEDKKIIDCRAIPTIRVLVGKKIRNQYDINGINNIILEWREKEITKAGMERLRPMPMQAIQVAFSMGGGMMLFKTLFTIYKIPFIEFEPRAWQKKIFGDLGVQYNKDTTKQASIQAAKQLFPGANFKATEKSRVDSHGMTDSANISLYTLLTDQ